MKKIPTILQREYKILEPFGKTLLFLMQLR
jgi:hypothetical protein